MSAPATSLEERVRIADGRKTRMGMSYAILAALSSSQDRPPADPRPLPLLPARRWALALLALGIGLAVVFSQTMTDFIARAH